MHPDNRRKFEYCRIPAWWAKGYTGRGVKVAVFENTSRGHGHSVADILRQVAPDAEILSRSRPLIEIEADAMTPGTRERLSTFYRGLVAEGVNIVEMSLSGTGTRDIEELERATLIEGGITPVTSAGNDGDPIESCKSAYLNTWIAVGAADLVDSKPKRLSYSETGPQLDVLGFSNLCTQAGVPFTGTSCAAPFVAGMLALYFQYHKERTGRYPTFDDAYEFVRANAEDLGDPGRDDLMGYGLFRLPAELPALQPPTPEPPAEPEPPPQEDPVEVDTMINDIQISPNFKLREFQSPDTGEVMLDPALLSKLQALRSRLGRPIIVNSGYRTPERNAAVGGSPKSQHMLGKAADIVVPGMTPKQVAAAAQAVGFDGIGTYATFVHVDVRGYAARWSEGNE